MLPSWQKELTRIGNNWGDTSMTHNQLVSFMIGQQSLMNDKSEKKCKPSYLVQQPNHSGNYANYSFARHPPNQSNYFKTYYPSACQIPATTMYHSNCGVALSPFCGHGFGCGRGTSAHDGGHSNAGSFSLPHFNHGGGHGFFSPGGCG